MVLLLLTLLLLPLHALSSLLFQLPNGDAVPVSIWTSTLQRTIETAGQLPFPKLRWKALDEIQAGICDGFTYEEISNQHPAEFEARQANKLSYRWVHRHGRGSVCAWRGGAAGLLPPPISPCTPYTVPAPL